MNNNFTKVRCENCYFRQADLCALQLTEGCPTFRPHTTGALARQAPTPRRTTAAGRDRSPHR